MGLVTRYWRRLVCGLGHDRGGEPGFFYHGSWLFASCFVCAGGQFWGRGISLKPQLRFFLDREMLAFLVIGSLWPYQKGLFMILLLFFTGFLTQIHDSYQPYRLVLWPLFATASTKRTQSLASEGPPTSDADEANGRAVLFGRLTGLVLTLRP